MAPETAGLTSQSTQEGEQATATIESTRAQTSTPLAEMAIQRTMLNDLTVQYQTAIQQRDAVATPAHMDMDSLRHELRASEEHWII